MASPPSVQTLKNALRDATAAFNSHNYASYRQFLHTDIVFYHIHSASGYFGIAGADSYFPGKFATDAPTFSYVETQFTFDPVSGVVTGPATWTDRKGTFTQAIHCTFVFVYVSSGWLIIHLSAR
jgi:hypothetical protein